MDRSLFSGGAQPPLDQLVANFATAPARPAALTPEQLAAGIRLAVIVAGLDHQPQDGNIRPLLAVMHAAFLRGLPVADPIPPALLRFAVAAGRLRLASRAYLRSPAAFVEAKWEGRRAVAYLETLRCPDAGGRVLARLIRAVQKGDGCAEAELLEAADAALEALGVTREPAPELRALCALIHRAFSEWYDPERGAELQRAAAPFSTLGNLGENTIK